MKILILCGTARSGNYSSIIADFVKQVANKHSEVVTEIVDPISAGITVENEANGDVYPELRKKVTEADGYIIVTPEYNHGFPGSLKMMLDMNMKAYIRKPVNFVGVSAGSFGGTRVIELLIPVVRGLGMIVSTGEVNFSNDADEIVDGKVKDPEKWERRVNRMLEELIWMVKALKQAREKKE